MNGERMLNHDVVTAAPDTDPERWLFVLHGIYGAGRNWASLVRRVVKARPEWGGVLVDLREHGGSRGFPAPHTIEAAAADVAALAESLGLEPGAVLGHSFGGKVAMALSLRQPAGLRQLWVVDSTPAAGPPRGSAWGMLEVVKSLPATFESRAAGVDALVAGGVAPPVAQWMATNLAAADGEYHWRFDLDAIEALLHDFFRTETWDALERPADGVAVHVVKAEDSSVLEGEVLARVERAAGGGGALHLHRVAGGHWVNADNPDAMIELLVRNLP
jgi:esterase